MDSQNDKFVKLISAEGMEVSILIFVSFFFKYHRYDSSP
jgi:hypothetical protein